MNGGDLTKERKCNIIFIKFIPFPNFKRSFINYKI